MDHEVGREEEVATVVEINNDTAATVASVPTNAIIANAPTTAVVATPQHMASGQGQKPNIIIILSQLLATNQPQAAAGVAPTSTVQATPVWAKPSAVQSAPQPRTGLVPIAPSPLKTATMPASEVLAGLNSSKIVQNAAKTDQMANRARKACNCTKSQCLKLYCDCFASGEFCNGCNCINCANNLTNEDERQRAIKMCLERNPNAFHPKIGKSRDLTERRHTKGCNCRRSGCLKNYCECYEAKILCSELCKCVACKNYQDSFERKTLMHLADAAEVRSGQNSSPGKSQWGDSFRIRLPVSVADRHERLHCSFLTFDVIEATCECLIAQAEYSENHGLNQARTEKLILEEFGRCIKQIIDTANNTKP